MADPHNQSQSLSNMLHSVTTKLAWRKVNYGPSLCSSAGFAVILYCCCSCFHYANMGCLTHTASSYSYGHILFLPLPTACSRMIHGLRVCWGVCCAISGIIKLTINDFCSQTNTCVTQWAAASDVSYFIRSVSMRICSRRLPAYETVYSLFLYTFLTRVSPSTFPCMQTCARRTAKESHTVHTLNPSILFFPLALCVLSTDVFHFDAQPLRTIIALHIAHTGGGKRTHARTHKVARLVGAMAAALLRSPRVAPGARLPVVCQRLRVEFIQIKAVE